MTMPRPCRTHHCVFTHTAVVVVFSPAGQCRCGQCTAVVVVCYPAGRRWCSQHLGWDSQIVSDTASGRHPGAVLLPQLRVCDRCAGQSNASHKGTCLEDSCGVRRNPGLECFDTGCHVSHVVRAHAVPLKRPVVRFVAQPGGHHTPQPCSSTQHARPSRAAAVSANRLCRLMCFAVGC